MAISKSSKTPPPPDPAAFVRLIDEGLAEPAVVSEAYKSAFHDWMRAAGLSYLDLLAKVPVVQSRDELDWIDYDPNAPAARLEALWRASLFEDVTPHAKREIKEEP